MFYCADDQMTVTVFYLNLAVGRIAIVRFAQRGKNNGDTASSHQRGSGDVGHLEKVAL